MLDEDKLPFVMEYVRQQSELVANQTAITFNTVDTMQDLEETPRKYVD
jgi:hypothetical protein